MEVIVAPNGVGYEAKLFEAPNNCLEKGFVRIQFFPPLNTRELLDDAMPERTLRIAKVFTMGKTERGIPVFDSTPQFEE